MAESVKGKAFARVDISHDELISLARVMVFWCDAHATPRAEEDVTTVHHLETLPDKLPDEKEIDEMVPPGVLSEQDMVDLDELAQAVASLFREAMVEGLLEENGTGVLRPTKVDD